MVTKSTPTPLPGTMAWGGKEVTVLAGTDLMDKEELVNKVFMITGVKFTANDQDKISYAYVEGEFEPGGKRFQFNDSSKNGVRHQVSEYFLNQGITVNLDEWYDVEILAPKGLRVSRFDALDSRGATVKAKAFYLTTSGQRD